VTVVVDAAGSAMSYNIKLGLTGLTFVLIGVPTRVDSWMYMPRYYQHLIARKTTSVPNRFAAQWMCSDPVTTTWALLGLAESCSNAGGDYVLLGITNFLTCGCAHSCT
jgi:hypothetical protein